MMQRRDFFKKLGVVAAVSAVAPVMSFAGGKTPKKSAKVKLKVPEIAENGAVVPVTVNVESPMTSSDYVKAIHILASKNFNSRCIDVNLTPANGKAMFSTRIKLGGTQEVSALVELSNGDFLIATQSVKVTIGGCG
ncbi:Sulfur oxidation protein SoxY [hydrothermal vent metagenome]|uniref:Sulfur oxidation protein SoxY n=1 Tax=hydrothermal vent metagenome TaxID=652676 RepID=A0A1W1C1Q0_9ZZZZ